MTRIPPPFTAAVLALAVAAPFALAQQVEPAPAPAPAAPPTAARPTAPVPAAQPNFEIQADAVQVQPDPGFRFIPDGQRAVMARPAVRVGKQLSLGASVSSAQPAIREQLKLPRGVGLVVDKVHAKGPAEAAGVKEHDLLEKLDDQWLVNPEQLAALLRGTKAGDEVSLTLIRQGQRQTVKAKVEEREEPVAADDAWGGVRFAPRTTAAPVTVDLHWDGAGQVGAPAAVPGAPAGGHDVVFFRTIDGNARTEWSDDQHTIALQRKDGKVTHVTVTDKKTNAALYDGPRDGVDKAVRPPILDKLKQAEDAAAAPAPGRVRLLGGLGGGGGGAAGGDPAAAWDVVVTRPGGVGAGGGGMITRAMTPAARAAGRGKVLRWQDDDHVLVLRALGKQPTYLLALSKKDGRVVYDGPVESDDQRKSLPAEIDEKFQMVVKHPETAKEFGAPAPAPADPAPKP